MEVDASFERLTGVPELTELGKRIEMLRIERGISKQQLARVAGTSRQQLWRVMTGKSELTIALRARLCEALDVGERDLTGHHARPRATDSVRSPATPPETTEGYLRDTRAVARTLATMPTGESGRLLKRRYLDLLEDAALSDRSVLGAGFFELRRRVMAGQL